MNQETRGWVPCLLRTKMEVSQGLGLAVFRRVVERRLAVPCSRVQARSMIDEKLHDVTVPIQRGVM
jgi:hypothetical protein